MDVDVARFDAADVQTALPEFVWLPGEYGAADGNVRPFGLHGQTVGLKAAPYRALQFFGTDADAEPRRDFERGKPQAGMAAEQPDQGCGQHRHQQQQSERQAPHPAAFARRRGGFGGRRIVRSFVGHNGQCGWRKGRII